MSCKQFENHLLSYLDGRASAAERREVESHLANCAACRTRVEEYRRLWHALDKAPVIEPSLGFDARLRQRIAAEPRPGLWSWFAPPPRLAIAVALLCLLSVWVSSRPPVAVEPQTTAAQTDQDFRMIKDLRVLEDYDVLSDFEPLSDLPQASAIPAPASTNREM
jgi:anti-sigma factor RsiW